MNQTFDEDLHLWADLGVGTVGLFFPKLERVGLDVAVSRVRDSGLSVSSVACVGFPLAAPHEWPDRRTELEAAIEAAAALEAGCLFVTAGVPGSLSWDECVAALAAAIGPVRDRADQLGLSVAVEHTNPMRRDIGFVHSLRDMVEVARQLDIGVIVELSNCWSERDVARTIADGVDTFRVVQISDYIVGTLTATERAVPGDGDIPLARLIQTLDSAGYRGPFELEMLGFRIEDEGYRTAITRAIGALDPILPTA
jgi:sugar phosphate isomerase/epimerase